MAGYDSDIHDPIDDLICNVENKKIVLSSDQLLRLLKIVKNLMDVANKDPFNKKKFFKTQLECDQAKCNIVQVIRIRAIILELKGINSDNYVLGCFTSEVKDEVYKKLLKYG